MKYEIDERISEIRRKIDNIDEWARKELEKGPQPFAPEWGTVGFFALGFMFGASITTAIFLIAQQG